MLAELGIAFGMLALVPASVLAADPLDPETAATIRSYVEDELAALNVPGAAVAIVRDDQVVFAEGFGRADDEGRAVTAQTPFDLASVSKSLTALAVMRQVEAGNLALDAAVREYLPWFGDEQPQLAEVTVRDLFGHLGGWTIGVGQANLADTYDGSDAIERNVRRLAATQPALAPGTFEYSNANYDVLAYLVEVVAGAPFAEVIARDVFMPLDMRHSHASRAGAEADGLAAGYYPFMGIPVAYEVPYVPGGAGSGFLFASAEDLAHALILHLNEGRYAETQVLSPELVAELHRPISRPDPYSGYSGGLVSYPLWAAGSLATDADPPSYRVPVMYEHGGDHASTATSILFLPEERWGVVVLLNMNDSAAPSRFHQLHTGIATLLLGSEPPATIAYEDPIAQYARAIAMAVVLLQVAGIMWALRRLRVWRRSPATRPQGALGVAVRLVPALLLDVALTVAAWWLLTDRAPGTPFEVILRYTPDVALLILLISILGIGWGVVRTVLSIRTLRSTTPMLA